VFWMTDASMVNDDWRACGSEATALGLVTLVVVSESMASTTMCVCPMIWPCAFSFCGLAKYVFCAFVNVPSWMPWVASVMVKVCPDAMVSKFLGDWNLEEGMLSTEGILPMGMGLQDPVVIWSPLVRGTLGRPSAHRLAKLFVDTSAPVWPVTGGFWPSSVFWMTDASMVNDDWRACGSEATAAGGAAAKTVEDAAAAPVASVVDALPVAAVVVDALPPAAAVEALPVEPLLPEEPFPVAAVVVDALPPAAAVEALPVEPLLPEEPLPVLPVELELPVEPLLPELEPVLPEEAPLPEPELELELPVDPLLPELELELPADPLLPEELELPVLPLELEPELPVEAVPVEAAEAPTVKVTVTGAGQSEAAALGTARATALVAAALPVATAAAAPPKVNSSAPDAEAAPLQATWSMTAPLTVRQTAFLPF
jgi:hypothetical protein